jgi:hypothetical protein
MDMKHGHAAKTYRMKKQHGHAAWTCNIDMQRRHAHQQATRTWHKGLEIEKYVLVATYFIGYSWTDLRFCPVYLQSKRKLTNSSTVLTRAQTTKIFI